MRKLTILAAGFALLTYGGIASAQISIGDEYRTAYDEVRDGFGEDYGNQVREAEERRALGRDMSKTAKRYISLATKAAQEGDFDKVISQTKKGLAEHTLTPYETSVLYQLNAAGHLQTQNFSNAKSSYELALATNGMNEEEEIKVNEILSKLNAAGIQ